MVTCPIELSGEGVYWPAWLSPGCCCPSQCPTLFPFCWAPSPLHLSWCFRIPFPHLRLSQHFTCYLQTVWKRGCWEHSLFPAFQRNELLPLCWHSTLHAPVVSFTYLFVHVFSPSVWVLFATISNLTWFLAWNRLSVNEWMFIWGEKKKKKKKP